MSSSHNDAGRPDWKTCPSFPTGYTRDVIASVGNGCLEILALQLKGYAVCVYCFLGFNQ